MSGSSDPYVYPGTDILRNLADIRDPEALARFETEASIRRYLEIRRQPVPGRFDTEHLKAVHHYLFQDVYAWAGQFRTTVLGKQEFEGGPVRYFVPPHLLEHEAERIFGFLRRSRILGGLSQHEFATQAALLLGSLNTLHPFREGNGRSQRLFVETVAHQAGHQLYFDVVSRERMVQASILSTNNDSAMMVRLFHEITDTRRTGPLRHAIAFLEANGFNWNDVYIATTTPGQEYSGRLVGRDQGAFMMRTAGDKIIIGNQQDISPEIRSGGQVSFTAHWPEIEHCPGSASQD